jgi:hypothetical protein
MQHGLAADGGSFRGGKQFEMSMRVLHGGGLYPPPCRVTLR